MAAERMWTLGKRRAWVAALAVAAISLGAFASTAAALPANFWGVVPQATPSPEQFQRLKRGGVESIRLPVAWSAVQPVAGGPFIWSGVDAMVRNAASSNLNLLPFLAGAPKWAVPVDRRYGSPKTLPVTNGRQISGWRNFVTQAVLRYGPGGSFWAENPAVPPHPVRTWQIWNEENFEYFVARPNPAQYGKLVTLSSTAIKAVDPGAKTILGGMFARPREAEFKRRPPLAYFATDFLEQMYETTPGVKSKFQGVALHPYTGTYKRLAPYIEEFRAVLKANHDAGKKLWITELGWSSQHPSAGNSFAKGKGGQAQQLKGAFGLLRAMQRKWRIAGVYWFSVDDQPGACNFCDGSGLFGEGFVPKPAWFAFARFAGGQP
jgi:polysaccharide biosynthesis protein PslG